MANSSYIPFLNYNIPDILDLFSRPSFSSFYMVFLPIGQVGTDLARAFDEEKLYNNNEDSFRLEEKISLLCSDASLPGATFNTVEVKGNRQGVVERYANYKIFPNIDLSFMVDGDHSVIKLFNTWMNFISPIQGNEESPNSFFRFRYPEDYVLDFYIVKFEKNENALKLKAFKKPPFEEGTTINSDNINNFAQSKKTVYKFKRAYPVNMASIPLSYDQSSLIKSSVTFQYDRFITFDIKKDNTPRFITDFVSNIIKGL